MNYIFQNDARLYPVIQKIGCFFRSALNLAETETDAVLSAEQINALWDAAKEKGFIGMRNGEDDCVLNSAAVANLALKTLGKAGRFVEVATFKNGVMNWYKSVKDRRAEHFIQKIRQSGPSRTHFRVVNRYGSVVFDPHNPPIFVVSLEYTVCYRFDKG